MMHIISKFIMCMMSIALIYADPMQYVEFFKENNVKMNIDGQVLSLYLQPDSFFYENSTSLKPQDITATMSQFINHYHTHEVQLIGHYEMGSTRKTIAIMKARAATLMNLLKVKHAGIIVSTKYENFVKYNHLPFWKDMPGDSFFEVKWTSNLPIDVSVLNG